MTAADRAKAAEPPKGVSPDLYAAALLTNDWEASELGIANLRDRIAETRAAARADADAHWTAAVEGLAESAPHTDACLDRLDATRGTCTCDRPIPAAHLRGLVTDNSEEVTA